MSVLLAFHVLLQEARPPVENGRMSITSAEIFGHTCVKNPWYWTPCRALNDLDYPLPRECHTTILIH